MAFALIRRSGLTSPRQRAPRICGIRSCGPLSSLWGGLFSAPTMLLHGLHAAQPATSERFLATRCRGRLFASSRSLVKINYDIKHNMSSLVMIIIIILYAIVVLIFYDKKYKYVCMNNDSVREYIAAKLSAEKISLLKFSRLCGIEQASLWRFLHGKTGLSGNNMLKLIKYIDLQKITLGIK